MGTLIKLYLSKAWTFLRPVVALFLSQVGIALAGAATTAVAAVAESAITGDKERRDAAFRLIEEDLKQKGIRIGVDVTTYAINLAIETALAGLKSGR